MNKEKFLNTGLLEQYVLGLTTPDESKIVEQHLEAFPELKKEVSGMQEALENYAKQYAVPPPGELKGQIMDQIEDIDQVPGRSRNSLPWRNWLSFAAIVALAAGYFFLNQRYKTGQDIIKKQEIALSACQSEKQDLLKAQQVYAFFNDSQTRAVQLRGTTISPEAAALVYWNEARQSAYINSKELPTPPTGKQYQVWADVEGEMISIGLLDRDQTDLQLISYIADAESLNITLEPVGGSPHPTVELLYVNAPLQRG